MLVLPSRKGGSTSSITRSPHFGVEDSIDNLYSLDLDSATPNDEQKLRANSLERDGNPEGLSGGLRIGNKIPKQLSKEPRELGQRSNILILSILYPFCGMMI